MESIKQKLIYQEMMSHPALFTHPHPQKIALIGKDISGITDEILKHPTITELWQTHLSDQDKNDPRIKLLSNLDKNAGSFDIVILIEEKKSSLSNYYELLANKGILLYQSTSPFELKTVKADYELLRSQLFDVQLLTFPQPDYPTGWRCAIMAIKDHPFHRIREKDIFNRKFSTKYYNFDVHKASLVLPEFMKEELLYEKI